MRQATDLQWRAYSFWDRTVLILATGLGIGILLDATIIRALFVPSLVVLFGKRNWWFPSGFARLLFVERSVEHHSGGSSTR